LPVTELVIVNQSMEAIGAAVPDVPNWRPGDPIHFPLIYL